MPADLLAGHIRQENRGDEYASFWAICQKPAIVPARPAWALPALPTTIAEVQQDRPAVATSDCEGDVVMSEFQAIAIRAFRFLEKEYGFRLVGPEKSNSRCQLTYLNATTGVAINYEYREQCIFVTLYRLIDGKLVKNPICYQDGSPWYGYGLSDVVQLRSPDDLLKPLDEYEDTSEFCQGKRGFRLYVTSFAKNLQNHASDILKGDFRIFEQLEDIVKDRVRQHDEGDLDYVWE